MNRELVRTNTFVRSLRRIVKKHPDADPTIEKVLQIIAEDAFDPRLKTHKLKGQLDGIWACSAGYDLRILFEFVMREQIEAILLLTIGTHDEVY